MPSALQGVEFDQINVSIPDGYKQMYDTAAAVWLQVKEAINNCKESELIEANHKKVCAASAQCALCPG